jgi:hypothetical protein
MQDLINRTLLKQNFQGIIIIKRWAPEVGLSLSSPFFSYLIHIQKSFEPKPIATVRPRKVSLDVYFSEPQST